MDRRSFIGGLVLLASSGRGALCAPNGIRFGVTAVFLHDRLRMLSRWKAYLQDRVGVPVEFVQRGGYAPIVDGLRAGQVDFAWICGYPYVLHARELRLAAVPVWRGRPLYQSYLLAGARSAATDLEHFAGRSFAFSDPLSNSGYLYIRYLLARQKRSVGEFFGRSFFAHSHANVVEAVAKGLAEGGAVDGYVWEVLAETNPALTARTRVLQRSPEFGFPPLVTAAHVPARLHAGMQRALFGMHESPEGRAVLEELRLDRFDAASPRLFDSIAQMARAVG